MSSAVQNLEPPASQIAVTTASASFRRGRSEREPGPPPFARASALARPMPHEAAVTSAVLPERLLMVSFFHPVKACADARKLLLFGNLFAVCTSWILLSACFFRMRWTGRTGACAGVPVKRLSMPVSVGPGERHSTTYK
jgi:hypothetical protein